MLVSHRFTCVLPEGTNAQQIRTSNWNDTHELENPNGICTADFDFTAQTPGGNLTAGITNIVTLSPVPTGVNASNIGHYLYLDNGVGTTEAVLITGGTAVSDATSGTVTFIPVNSYSGSWTIKSATAGCQEAIRSNAQNTLIYFPRGESVTYAPILVDVEHSRIRGVGDSSVRNEVGVMFTVTAGFVEISHLCLTGLRTAASIGIQCNGIQCYFHHLKMLTFNGAIRIYGGFHSMISYVFTRNMLDYGILLEDGVGHTVSFFSIATDTGVYNGAATAAIIVRTEGCIINYADILHTNIGIYVNPLVRHVEWLQINNSWLDNNITHAFQISNSSGYHARGITLNRVWMATSGAQANSTTGIGISITGSGTIYTIEFNDCWIHNHLNENARIVAGDDIRFVNCRFMGGNVDAGPTTPNLFLGTTGSAKFINCEFGNRTLWPSESYYSHIFCDTNTGGIVIENCEFVIASITDSNIHNAATTPGNVKWYGFNRGQDDAAVTIGTGSIITTPPGVLFTTTGTTGVDNLLPVWQGRVIVISKTGAGTLAFNTGANIGTALTLAVGETGIFEYWGSSWKARK